MPTSSWRRCSRGSTIKQEVFVALDRICGDDAVLATNTSAIPITKIAAVTSRPESVVGTHFFSPVPMMQLCELVRGHLTSDETLADRPGVRRGASARPASWSTGTSRASSPPG